MASDRIDEAFGGLDEEDDDEQPDESETSDKTVEETTEETTSTTEMESSSDVSRSVSTPDEPASKAADSQDDANQQGDIHTKAFDYSEAKQSPMYARPEAWDEYEDAMELEVERQLRDLDIRNIQKRELNEAMLLVAAENTDLVVEKALELRREG